MAAPSAQPTVVQSTSQHSSSRPSSAAGPLQPSNVQNIQSTVHLTIEQKAALDTHGNFWKEFHHPMQGPGK